MSTNSRSRTDSKAKKLINPRTSLGEVQKVRTRAAIVQAAIPVFAELGPDNPVVDDFVRAAGISRGTFYNYFQTPKELLDAVLIHLSQEITGYILSAVGAETNPVFRLSTAARLFYRKARLDPVLRAFIGSVIALGEQSSAYARIDLKLAMEQALIEPMDLDLAQSIATGILSSALRVPSVDIGGPERSRDVARVLLRALGANKRLIDRALSIELPPLEGPVAQQVR